MSVPEQQGPAGSAARFRSVGDGPLDLEPLLAAPVRRDSCPWVAAAGCVRPEALPALRRDFPRLGRPGHHPVDTFAPQGEFAALLRRSRPVPWTAPWARSSAWISRRCRGWSPSASPPPRTRAARTRTAPARSPPCSSTCTTVGLRPRGASACCGGKRWKTRSCGGRPGGGQRLRLPPLRKLLARPHPFRRRAAGGAGGLAAPRRGAGAQAPARPAGLVAQGPAALVTAPVPGAALSP